jgi:soluble lytic murein transglycosylase-like protein
MTDVCCRALRGKEVWGMIVILGFFLSPPAYGEDAPCLYPIMRLQEQADKVSESTENDSETDAENMFDPIIIQAAHCHGIDPALIKAIIKAESQYNPNAVSKRGAKGLMQLMPRTAESVGVEDLFDPEHNINGGTLYFKQMLTRFEGEIDLALAAYNAGAATVKKYGGVPPFEATRCYMDNVLKYYQEYKGKIQMTTSWDEIKKSQV